MAGTQCEHPFPVSHVVDSEKTPGGSSSGSAVAVSAGFAPVAIGTETDGSIQVPADRAALYAIKATVGVLPTEGLMPFSSFSDSLGPMAKSAKDIANLLTIMDNGTDYTQFLSAKWEGLRIGFLDPEAWRPGEGAVKPLPGLVEQMESILC